MLNAPSAITYNTGKGYSTKAIGLMQDVVRAPTLGSWNTDSVTGVYKFQQARPAVGTPDGKMGPKTPMPRYWRSTRTCCRPITFRRDRIRS